MAIEESGKLFAANVRDLKKALLASQREFGQLGATPKTESNKSTSTDNGKESRTVTRGSGEQKKASEERSSNSSSKGPTQTRGLPTLPRGEVTTAVQLFLEGGVEPLSD